MNKKRGIPIRTISILGSGWLGLPLAEHFVMMGNFVKASTTSESRTSDVTSVKAEPFIIDIEKLPNNIQTFLQANILIVNIPSKNIDGFSNLIQEIEKSEIEKVLFVSSTSVYEDINKTISESDFSISFIKLLKPSIFFDGMLTIKILAWRKVWMLLSSLSISMMTGSALTVANSESLLSDVVEAFTLLPILTKCSAKGSPSQPLPNMLIVLIVIPLLIHMSLQDQV